MSDKGYVIVPRELVNSLMERPPLQAKLFLWMVARANWRDRDRLKRGQFVTTIDEMREAMAYLVGWRRVAPSRDEIRKCYESLTKTTMITTRKTTRGMVITIMNYDGFQNSEACEAHNETHNDFRTKAAECPHDTEEIEVKKNNLSVIELENRTPSELFDVFWQAYPRKTHKGSAQRAWAKFRPDAALVAKMLKALEWQVRERQWQDIEFIPYPASWLNGKRWEDEGVTATPKVNPHGAGLDPRLVL